MLIRPAAALPPLLGDRAVTGLARTAEVRLLTAHADMVRRTLADLGPAGVETARSTPVELARAVRRTGRRDRRSGRG